MTDMRTYRALVAVNPRGFTWAYIELFYEWWEARR
jgi:hypothetical protein